MGGQEKAEMMLGKGQALGRPQYPAVELSYGGTGRRMKEGLDFRFSFRPQRMDLTGAATTRKAAKTF